MHVTSMSCCGIRELAGISEHPDKKALLTELQSRMYGVAAQGARYDATPGSFGRRFAHVIFSEAGAASAYGRKLREAIEFYHLGTVVESPRVVNPNSQNQLRAFLWTIDHDTFSKWDPKVAAPLPVPKTRVRMATKAAPRVSP